MHNTNPSHRNDDFTEDEIEISDLTAKKPEKEHPSSPIQHFSLKPRYSLRQRRKQLLITSGIIILTLIGLLSSLAPVRNLVLSGLGLTTPEARRLTGDDLFYFQALPSWGTFKLDGKPLTRNPIASTQPPLRLPRGQHTLEWSAKPFKATISCQLSVPPLSNTNSQQACITHALGANDFAENAFSVSFPVTPSLTMLPPEQQQALIGSIQQLFDIQKSSTILEPGELYTYNRATMPAQTADQPMNAHLRFLLDTDTTKPAQCNGLNFGSGCSIAGHDCRQFCTLNWPDASTQPTTYGWHIAAIMRPTWTFDPIGAKADTRQQSASNTQGEQHFVALHITLKQNKWQVAFHPQGASSFDDPNCVPTIGSIMARSSYRYVGKTQQPITWAFLSAANRSIGCLAAAQLPNDTAQASPLREPTAYVIQRFGVLLAVNSAAHQLWPDLPVANKAAQDAAQEIITHTVFIS
ncbi:hypothetical protein EPA93_32750 [Ktedonosporobacter rubrisoli]|uniref:Uncharacterized protein n=1 Tax=Ktedonosporobacter rubrisoli TaxID=2509675 RepID=A0A4P6JXK4_KTERU|nr:hypothetical protein [Ktedonosporobacter rubrisoli]QBD80488.1 hypothetical protein EPA93_32750 [Ktedonosporobacter rubrisoli]